MVGSLMWLLLNYRLPQKLKLSFWDMVNFIIQPLYVQVRFELIYMSEISYLIVHLHEKARKDACFDMTLKQEIKKGHENDAHLNNKEKLINKQHRMYVKNTREWIKNHDLSKYTTFLLSLACITYGKEISFTMKLPFSPINSLLSSLKYLVGFLP